MNARSAIGLVATCSTLASASTAWATDPLNSNDKSSSSSANPSPSPGDSKSDAHAHTEATVLPVAGGTSDIGFGVGEFAGIARLKKGYDPYLWNLESAGLVTFRSQNGQFAVPYQDLWIKLTVPRLFGGPMRLEIRPEYTWERTLEYDGMGNASSATIPAGEPDSYRWYGRLHPELDVRLRWRVVDHLAGSVGVRYTENWLQVSDQSKLADDIKTGSAEVKSLIGAVNQHAVGLFVYGVQWDDRDSEVSTHKGSFHEATLKVSPGGSGAFPYRYGQGTFVSRLFVPFGSRITLALRGVFDVYFGSPPFYELAKYDDTYALGGILGVRGIPAQRYYGKMKAFGNVELRADVARFHALGKNLLFGMVGFFDGGRVWADTTPHPELDGTGIGLKYGTGGGLRLQAGEAFVLRADVAWSPDARPISGYFAAGQIF